MNKELTALETWYLVKKYLNIYHHQAIKENIDVETVEGYPIDIIETALKALEIIKNKQVDVGLLLACESEPEYLNRCCNRYWTNDKCGWKRLSQEEYKFLKEVLK